MCRNHFRKQSLCSWLLVLYLAFPSPSQSTDKVESNPPAEANSTLTSIVNHEIPGLSDHDDWSAVQAIRQWASTHVDWCSKELLLDQDPSFEFYGKSAQVIFEAYSKDLGGVWCGGTAYSLMLLYRELGFNAWTLDVGIPGAMSHVVTVVEVSYGGIAKRSIQDATFNLTYTDLQGGPLDYREIVQLLAERRHDEVCVLEGSVIERDFLLHAKDAELRANYGHMLAPDAVPVEEWADRQKFCSRFSLDNFLRKYGDRIHNHLVAVDLPPDAIYLYLFPLGSSDPDILQSYFEGPEAVAAGKPEESPPVVMTIPSEE